MVLLSNTRRRRTTTFPLLDRDARGEKYVIKTTLITIISE